MSVYGKFESAEKKYKDIIDLPHPTSRKHPRMSLEARAAQFAPFSALTGHKEELQEEHRLTKDKIIQDEEYREELDYVLGRICHREGKAFIQCKYFVADKVKDGGDYKIATGIFKRIDSETNHLVLKDGMEIPLGDIVELEEIEDSPLDSV